MEDGTVSQADRDALTALNSSYVASVQRGDVNWFRENLADDFMCTNPDASFLDKSEFLELIGRGARISALREDNVQIRLMGDFAIIHARITYQGASGTPQAGRFTDDWAKRDGVWRCVSAHTAGSEF
jgi:ketosteroid isomerase-like protein